MFGNLYIILNFYIDFELKEIPINRFQSNFYFIQSKRLRKDFFIEINLSLLI